MTGRETPWIIGCGDIGRRIARRYADSGTSAMAVLRSEAGARSCGALGAKIFRVDLDDPNSVATLSLDGAHVIYLAPPPADGVTDPRIRNFLDRHGAHIRRLVLISTTGVYGDCDGEWIDEDTPALPCTDRGQRRLDAERAVADWSARHGGAYMILRVPGIYAEERLPLERLIQGLPVVRESESGYTNRIHAEDLARICIAALESKQSALVLNATDGHPTTMTEYFNRVADAFKLPRPAQVSLAEAATLLSPGMLSYAMESRKIGNRRLLESLPVTLEYPDLQTTLARISMARQSD